MPGRQLRAPFLGAWRLACCEVCPRDGSTVTYPPGRDVRGWLLYTSDGYMSA
ncbi:lipocalin-like domain-containing protein [Burkholderia sp. IMCC1007]|uniref:lipocalin-like domain-containing protein n=1 Tax=Burkholderia sp. IMCC1007 TaxID=3004104 RepID=UPI0022B347F9|nr:lipocalin-like domain-containing protein [Burkholderia sp. IMCC1007]